MTVTIRNPRIRTAPVPSRERRNGNTRAGTPVVPTPRQPIAEPTDGTSTPTTPTDPATTPVTTPAVTRPRGTTASKAPTRERFASPRVAAAVAAAGRRPSRRATIELTSIHDMLRTAAALTTEETERRRDLAERHAAYRVLAVASVVMIVFFLLSSVALGEAIQAVMAYLP